MATENCQERCPLWNRLNVREREGCTQGPSPEHVATVAFADTIVVSVQGGTAKTFCNAQSDKASHAKQLERGQGIVREGIAKNFTGRVVHIPDDLR